MEKTPSAEILSWELAPLARAKWYWLTNEYYKYACDAEVYLEFYKKLEHGKSYTFAELANKYGMRMKSDRPWLPPILGRDYPPSDFVCVIEKVP